MREAFQTFPSYAGCRRECFPDFPCGTRLSGSVFSSCHLSCQKLSSSHFSLCPSISLPPHVSLCPFFPSSIYVSRTYLAIPIKMREKSRDRTRLSNQSIVYRESNQKIWAQTVKIVYNTYHENENCECRHELRTNNGGRSRTWSESKRRRLNLISVLARWRSPMIVRYYGGHYFSESTKRHGLV